MMSPELIYIKFLLKVNKGDSQGKIAIDKERFVLIFNEVKNRWVEKHLKQKDSILIDSLWEVVKTKDLIDGTQEKEFTEFIIPEDFYELILANCRAKKGECKKDIFLREVKNQDKNTLRFNVNYKPDFDFEWSFCSLQDNKIRVYRDDFEVITTSIEYYKVIPDIDIEGYEHLDGKASKDIGIELSDQYVDQIINLAAEEFMRDFQDEKGLAISKERTKSQE